MNKTNVLYFCSILIFLCTSVSCQSSGVPGVIIKWDGEIPSGNISVTNGKIVNLKILGGQGITRNNTFRFGKAGSNSLRINLSDVNINPGYDPTLITVNNGSGSFSFLLRDINYEYPVYIPEYRVIVCRTDDERSSSDIVREISERRSRTKLQVIMEEPEETFQSSSSKTRDQVCPIWLGISRDMRIFEISHQREMDMISVKNASQAVVLPELNGTEAEYCYIAGRGVGVEANLTRRLDDGVLPILHTTLVDDDVIYKTITFTSPEGGFSGLKEYGTNYLVADHNSSGHMFTQNQLEILGPLLKQEETKSEGPVLYYRCLAINRASVPRYAWFRTIRPGAGWWEKFSYTYDKKTGFSYYDSGRIFGISKLNNAPLPGEEIAVLIKPGDTAVFEFLLPHLPLSPARAEKLAGSSFKSELYECRKFWNHKLANAASIELPEKRIEEMVKAGLLHLDLVTYGREPDGTLAPCIGVYSPIGTESSPIIQFYNSIGLPELARRSLNYFLDKQHDDGMIQNFGGYMVETGAALWSMGEYYRYTGDKGWINEVKPKLLKACDFLVGWRNKNKADNIMSGYGMIDGKVADPEDPYHQFMLNAYGYLGLSRAAEMLSETDAEESAMLLREAQAWKQDIRNAFFKSWAQSPVVPLGDGSWCPTAPPWTEAKGPRLLYLTDETYVSHGTFTVPDALLGPLYLVFCEVLDPMEPVSKMMLNYHTELLYQRNTAFSQPYYSRHDWLQLKQGLVKPFLKTYYSSFTALADRETYTFWEHLYHASVHKTHEEAWFLMATRWMLYMEDGNTLKLLPGIPRNWMEDGKSIRFSGMASYFGAVSLAAESHLDKGYIEATVVCDSFKKPGQIVIRIPHPREKEPKTVTGGIYDEAAESVIVNSFNGKATVRLEF